MTKPTLIGLSGLAGCGKDTVRLVLESQHDFDGIAFADPIRDMLSTLLETCGIGDEWMIDRDLKEQKIPEIGASYRQLAQMLGTEWGRAIDQNLWVKIVAAKIAMFSRFEPAGIVISDVRFPNEAEWIHSQGGYVWKVLRPGTDPVRAHESEAFAETLPYDYVILNSGTIPDLTGAVAAALHYHSVKA